MASYLRNAVLQSTGALIAPACRPEHPYHIYMGRLCCGYLPNKWETSSDWFPAREGPKPVEFDSELQTNAMAMIVALAMVRSVGSGHPQPEIGIRGKLSAASIFP